MMSAPEMEAQDTDILSSTLKWPKQLKTKKIT